MSRFNVLFAMLLALLLVALPAHANTAKVSELNGCEWTQVSSQGVKCEGGAAGDVATFKGTTTYNATATYRFTGLDTNLPPGTSGRVALTWDPFPQEDCIAIDYSAVYLTDLKNPHVAYNVNFGTTNLESVSRFINDQGEVQLQIIDTYCRKKGTLSQLKFEID